MLKISLKKKKKRREQFDSIYFCSKSHFEDDGTQNYLLYQPIQRYFKRIDGFDDGNYRNYIYYWKSEGFSDEKINSFRTSDTNYYDTSKIRVKFNGGCLK